MSIWNFFVVGHSASYSHAPNNKHISIQSLFSFCGANDQTRHRTYDPWPPHLKPGTTCPSYFMASYTTTNCIAPNRASGCFVMPWGTAHLLTVVCDEELWFGESFLALEKEREGGKQNFQMHSFENLGETYRTFSPFFLLRHCFCFRRNLSNPIKGAHA